MSKYIPIFVVIGVLIVTAGAIYVAVSKSASPQEGAPAIAPPVVDLKPTPSGEPKKKPAGMTIEGADIEQRDPQGQLEWKVKIGGELEFDKDSQVVTGQDVQFEMVQADRLPVIINAPVFEADNAARRLTFRQGVTGHMTDGSAQFKVSHLTYDFDTKKMVGTGGAHFVQGKNTATAREIVLDAVAKKVRMRGGVRFEHRG